MERFFCGDCGAELASELSLDGRFIAPCEDCFDDAFECGFQAGFEEGLESSEDCS